MKQENNSLTFTLFRMLGGNSGMWLTLYPLVYLLFARRRELSDVSAVDGSALGFILYTFVAFVIACNDLSRLKSRVWALILFQSPLVWYVLYTVLAVVSMCWSVDYKMTGYRAFEAFSIMLLMLSTLINVARYGSFSLLFSWTSMYAVLTIIAQCLTRVKNSLDVVYLLQSSQMFAPVMFYAVVFSSCARWKKYIVAFFSFVSGSTVSYIGLTLGSVVLLNHKKMKHIAVVGFILLTMAAVMMGPSALLKETLFADKEAISLEHTSGRNQVMEVVLNTLPENPIGNGFFVGEPYILYQHFRGAINGHNSFFSAAMGLGYPGVILMAFFFIHLGGVVLSNKLPKQVKACLFGCFCVAFLNSMGNPGIGSRVYGGWISTMYIYVLISVLTSSKNTVS